MPLFRLPLRLLTAPVLALLLVVSACGGGDGGRSDAEKKAIDNIATHFANQDNGVLDAKDAQCFARKFVDGAGLPALRRSGLIDKDGKVVQQQSTAKFDASLSGKYADAYLGCVDFPAAAAANFVKADKGLDEAKLTDCLRKALPNELMKKVIVATQTSGSNDSADVASANAKLTACQKSSRKAGAK